MIGLPHKHEIRCLPREDDMKGKFNFKLGALCIVLGAMLLMPALGQAKGAEEARYKEQNDRMIKELKLAPEKEKASICYYRGNGAGR